MSDKPAAQAEVTIEHDYVVIDTDQWLSRRIGDALEEQTERLQAFLGERYGHWAHHADEWLRSEGADTDYADQYLTGHYDTCISENSLSQDLSFTLFMHPEWGDCVIVTRDNYGYALEKPTIYADASEYSEAWLEWDAYGMECPADVEHSLAHRSGELVTYGGSFESVRDLFPDGIVTTPDEGDPYIACPTCGAHMTVYPY